MRSEAGGADPWDERRKGTRFMTQKMYRNRQRKTAEEIPP
jgi:hypothetical protein